eukprot:982021-Rhodomonas_salina.1
MQGNDSEQHTKCKGRCCESRGREACLLKNRVLEFIPLPLRPHRSLWGCSRCSSGIGTVREKGKK